MSAWCVRAAKQVSSVFQPDYLLTYCRALTPPSPLQPSLITWLKSEPARHNGVFLRDRPATAGEEEGAGLGQGGRKECVSGAETGGAQVVSTCGGSFSSPFGEVGGDACLRPCSRSGDTRSHRGQEKSCRRRAEPGRVSRTADVQRPAATAAISMFINTGRANKLQPCVWRLRSA